MELAIQYEVYEVINKMITKLENRENRRKYYNNNKQIFKKASKKYQQSDKGKEKCKELVKRYEKKKREIILKRREEEDIVPTIVGGGGEILSTGYKRRNWTKKEEDILRECKRRCKSPYKAGMTWKQIGIKLNRPQKQIREKWRRMIEEDREDSDEEIVLQPNIGLLY